MKKFAWLVFVSACVCASSVHSAQQPRFAGGRLVSSSPRLIGSSGGLIPERGALGPCADFDGDGDLDALHDSGLLLNNGSGLFTFAHKLDLAAERRLALFDADGDGKLDLLTRAHLYLGDGAGDFSDASAALPPGLASAAAAIADFDGDGDLDLATGHEPSFPPPAHEGQLSLNDGSGFFADATAQLPPGFGRVRSLAAGDVDSDGDTDLVVSRAFAELWRNAGPASFTHDAAALSPGSDTPLGIALADLDADGDLDLAIAGFGASRALRNDGTGVFSEIPLPPVSLQRDSSGVVVLDREGDGDADLVFLDFEEKDAVGAAFHSSPLRLLVNDGAAGFSASSDLEQVRGDAQAGFAADVDGDGDVDLVVMDGAFPNRLYLNDGAGKFGAVPVSGLELPLAASPAGGRVVAIGDLNGDGFPDGFTPQRVLLNGPLGVLTPAANAMPALPTPCFGSSMPLASDVALGDIDGDGDLDAYIAVPLNECARGDQYNRLWINDGHAGFSDQTLAHLPSGSGEEVGVPYQVALIELDGDGALDAFCARGEDNDGAGFATCYLNDGTGVFAVKETLYIRAGGVGLGDLDGDGDSDLLAPADQFPFVPSRVFANDGHGHFVPAELASGAGVSWTQVVLGDIDGDGDLDAHASFLGRDAALYVNDGTGVFGDEPARLRSSLAGADGQFVDLDLDGDLDLLTTSELFVNAEGGFFQDESQRASPWGYGKRMAIGDLDRDGDPDALVVDETQSVVAVGLARQLVSEGPPRIGKRHTLVVHGPANEPYVLRESLGSAQIFLGARGWFLLDPSQIVLTRSGRLRPDGEQRERFLVPNDALLLGLTSYWQAFVGAPSRSTNLLATTITGL